MRVQPRPIDQTALRAWLSAHQWTQDELSRVLDVNHATVERWAQGANKPPPYFSYVLDHLDTVDSQSALYAELKIHSENAALCKQFLKEHALWSEFDQWLAERKTA